MLIARLALIVVFCAKPLAGEVANAHELPDGFVEKAVEVVIRDSTATLKYYVGVNEVTQQRLEKTWNDDQLSISAAENAENSFGRNLLKRLSKTVTVNVNGQRVELRPKTANNPGKHHYACVAELEFDLVDGSNEILITDGEFQQLESAARYSLKAAGSTMSLKSNVAPIIIRAKRHRFKPADEQLRKKTCRIHATVLTASSSSNPPKVKLN